MTKPRCENCKFAFKPKWNINLDFQCRRFPPTFAASSNGIPGGLVEHTCYPEVFRES